MDGHGVSYGYPDQARVTLDPRLVGRAEVANAANDTGNDKLGSQDGVDLSDKLVADVDGGFSDRATELERRMLVPPPDR